MTKKKLKIMYAHDRGWEILSGARAGNYYNRKIRDLAQIAKGKSNLAHKKLIKKINLISPFEIKRDLYILNYFDIKADAGWIFDGLGKRNPVVSDAVANQNYFFKNHSGEDMFDHIVAHEYGHIIFDDFIEPKIKKMSLVASKEEKRRRTEAFAFWFGNKIFNAGISKSQLDYYTCSSNGNLFNAYQEIHNLEEKSGVSRCFNSEKLLNIFKKTIN